MNKPQSFLIYIIAGIVLCAAWVYGGFWSALFVMIALVELDDALVMEQRIKQGRKF